MIQTTLQYAALVYLAGLPVAWLIWGWSCHFCDPMDFEVEKWRIELLCVIAWPSTLILLICYAAALPLFVLFDETLTKELR